jgi:hypothetical protein
LKPNIAADTNPGVRFKTASILNRKQHGIKSKVPVQHRIFSLFPSESRQEDYCI